MEKLDYLFMNSLVDSAYGILEKPNLLILKTTSLAYFKDFNIVNKSFYKIHFIIVEPPFDHMDITTLSYNHHAPVIWFLREKPPHKKTINLVKPLMSKYKICLSKEIADSWELKENFITIKDDLNSFFRKVYSEAYEN